MSPRLRIATSLVALILPTATLGGCAHLAYQSATMDQQVTGPVSSEWASAPASTYRYYPEAQVYFSDDREIYYWQNAMGDWEQGRHLPFYVKIDDIFDYQTVALHVDDPTIVHHAFVNAFPAADVPQAPAELDAIVTVTDADIPDW